MASKILIVDDEEKIRTLIRTSLEFEDGDFEIFEARDGFEALEKAREIKPKLMILDVMMPGKSGYEVCKDIKSSPETRDIYVLFLTARGSAISEKTIQLSGGDELMIKPFTPDELGKKVRKAIGIT